MDGYIGEIKQFPYTFIPQDWLPCDGSTYRISQYQALYSIIGNQFGGSVSQGTFSTPNLQGQIVNGTGQSRQGTTYTFGGSGGEVSVGLTQNSIPSHKHTLMGAFTGTTPFTAVQKVATDTSFLSNLATSTKAGFLYQHIVQGTSPANVMLGYSSIGSQGQGAPHSNMAPYLPVLFGICAMGDYPPQP